MTTNNPLLVGFAFLTALTIGQAQPILSIDFNKRANELTTESGFTSFVIGSLNGSGGQSNYYTTNIIGSYAVSLGASGTNIRYDDRLRTTPINSGDFTQSLLLRDFVFCNSTAADTGLDINIAGLTGGQVYQVTIWAFDTSSGGSRISDWYAAGYLAREGYLFDGNVLPTNNSQYQFSFKIPCPENGELLIQGRRNPTSTSGQPSVFINALQIEPSVSDPPTIVTQPLSQEVFAGETAIFSVVPGGTAPFSYQWYKNMDAIPDATNKTLYVTNAQSTEVADYAVVVSNNVGEAPSDSAALTVKPVGDITTALISYWPLDELTSSSLMTDITTNINDLTVSNLSAANLVAGYRGNAVSFDGTNSHSLLYRDTAALSPDLPLYSHTSYTVALWVKGHVTNGPPDCRVFSESATNHNNPLMTIGTANDGTNPVVDIFIRYNNGSTPHNHKKSGLIAFDNAWHHIAWVDDKGLARLYVDGIQDTNDFTYTRGTLAPHILSVGGILRSNGMSSWFTGLIDDVAVWGRALSTEEVNYVMTNAPVVWPAPRILDIELSDLYVTLQIESADPTAVHQVEETLDLASPSWSLVTPVILSDPVNNQLTATLMLPGDGLSRFYRIVRAR